MDSIFNQLKSLGYSDEEIQQEFNRRGMEYPSTQDNLDPQGALSQQSTNLNTLYNSLAEQGYKDDDIVKEFKSRNFSKDQIEEARNQQYALMSDEQYNLFIEDIANGLSLKDIKNSLLNEGVDEKSANKLISSFETTRFFKNKSEGSKAELYSTYLKRTNPHLNDKQLDNLIKQYNSTEGKTFLDQVKSQLSAIERGALQQWYGFKQMLFDDQETSERIKELAKEERRAEAESGNIVDLGDVINPVNVSAFLTGGATAGLGFLGRAGINALVGGAGSAIDTLGEGGSTQDAVVSGGIGAALPVSVEVLTSAIPLLKPIFNRLAISKEQAETDVKNALGDMSINELNDVIQTALDNKLDIGIGALTKSGSPTYNLGKMAYAFGELRNIEGVEKAVGNNASKFSKYLYKELDKLSDTNISPELKVAEGKAVLSDDVSEFFSQAKQANIDIAKGKESIAWDLFRDSSSEIPISRSDYTSLLEIPQKVTIDQSGNLKLDGFKIQDLQGKDVTLVKGSPDYNYVERINQIVDDLGSKPMLSIQDLADAVSQIKKAEPSMEVAGKYKDTIKLIQTDISKRVDSFIRDSYPNVFKLYDEAKTATRDKISIMSKEMPDLLKNVRIADSLDRALKNAPVEDLAKTYNTFVDAGLEKEWNNVAKRYLTNYLVKSIDPTTSEAQFPQIQKNLQTILQNKNLAKIFGINTTNEGESLRKSLEKAYNLSKILKKQEELYRGFITENSPFLVKRFVASPIDTTRNFILRNTYQTNEEIVPLLNSINKQIETGIKETDKMLLEEILKNPLLRGLKNVGQINFSSKVFGED